MIEHTHILLSQISSETIPDILEKLQDRPSYVLLFLGLLVALYLLLRLGAEHGLLSKRIFSGIIIGTGFLGITVILASLFIEPYKTPLSEDKPNLFPKPIATEQNADIYYSSEELIPKSITNTNDVEWFNSNLKFGLISADNTKLIPQPFLLEITKVDEHGSSLLITPSGITIDPNHSLGSMLLDKKDSTYRSILLPQNKYTPHTRRFIELDYTTIGGLKNRSGPDIQICNVETSINRPSAYLFSFRRSSDLSWTRWRYKPVNDFELSIRKTPEVIFFNEIDFIDSGVPPNELVDKIRIASALPSDRIAGIEGATQGFVIFNKEDSMLPDITTAILNGSDIASSVNYSPNILTIIPLH
jgi:hypothetical protein